MKIFKKIIKIIILVLALLVLSITIQKKVRMDTQGEVSHKENASVCQVAVVTKPEGGTDYDAYWTYITVPHNGSTTFTINDLNQSFSLDDYEIKSASMWEMQSASKCDHTITLSGPSGTGRNKRYTLRCSGGTTCTTTAPDHVSWCWQADVVVAKQQSSYAITLNKNGGSGGTSTVYHIPGKGPSKNSTGTTLITTSSNAITTPSRSQNIKEKYL